MSWLLDTCVVSELSRPRPEKKVVRWVEEQPEAELFISTLVIGEMHKGFILSDNAAQRNRLEKLIEKLLIRFDERILPLDLASVREWGNIQAVAKRQGYVLPVVDSLMAATALAHNLTVVTRNTSDLKYIQVPVFNPWL